MKKTAKFAISMPDTDFRDLESSRREAGKTRSAFILDAVRISLRSGGKRGRGAGPGHSVKEGPGRYGVERSAPEAHPLRPLTDIAEIRRRAMAASGRFCSEEGDLSLRHDEVLAEDYTEAAPGRSADNDSESRRKD
jgi:hypothetical protein